MKIDKEVKSRIIAIILGLLIFILHNSTRTQPHIGRSLNFVEMAAIVRLNFTSNSYVRLTNEPLQILISQDDWLNYVGATNWYDADIFRSKYFDFESVSDCDNTCFRGYREGVRYHVTRRPLTQRYFIISIRDTRHIGNITSY